MSDCDTDSSSCENHTEIPTSFDVPKTPARSPKKYITSSNDEGGEEEEENNIEDEKEENLETEKSDEVRDDLIKDPTSTNTSEAAWIHTAKRRRNMRVKISVLKLRTKWDILLMKQIKLATKMK